MKTSTGDHVIVLHGIWMRGIAMFRIAGMIRDKRARSAVAAIPGYIPA